MEIVEAAGCGLLLSQRSRIARRLIAGAIAFAIALPAAAQDQAKIAAGERVYNTYCSTCHGDNLVSSGQTYDLRKLTANDRARFENSVLNGKNQMPPWKGAISDEQIEQIWQYVRANGNDR